MGREYAAPNADASMPDPNPIPPAAELEEPTPAAEAPVVEMPAHPAVVADAPAETPADAPADAPAEGTTAEATPALPPMNEADCARRLAEQFPALFGPGVVKPVKLRIQADIQQRAPGVFTKKALSLFLHRHTTGSAYLRALLAESTRFDLDGQPAGEIAAEHKEAARVEVERRRAIVEAKREAGRQAARAARAAARPPAEVGPGSDRVRPEPAPSTPGARERPMGGRPRPGGAPQGNARHADRPRDVRAERPVRTEPGESQPRNRRPPPPQGPHPRPTRPFEPRHDDGGPRPEPTPAVALSPEAAAEAEARRQRALLLRSFEASPLSKANFGALKGLSEKALDALLVQALKERAAR